MHPSAKIGKDCKIGPNVSIGIGCELENGVRVANAVLLHRVKVALLYKQAVVCSRLECSSAFGAVSTLRDAAATRWL